MLRRLCLILVCAALPLVALADTTSTPDPNAGLGPNTTNPGSSSADSASLQPAGLAPLQATTGDGANLSAPASALQAPASSTDALRVLASEADGTPHGSPDSGANNWGWLGFSLLFAAIVGAIFIVLRDRRRFREH